MTISKLRRRPANTDLTLCVLRVILETASAVALSLGVECPLCVQTAMIAAAATLLALSVVSLATLKTSDAGSEREGQAIDANRFWHRLRRRKAAFIGLSALEIAARAFCIAWHGSFRQPIIDNALSATTWSIFLAVALISFSTRNATEHWRHTVILSSLTALTTFALILELLTTTHDGSKMDRRSVTEPMSHLDAMNRNAVRKAEEVEGADQDHVARTAGIHEVQQEETGDDESDESDEQGSEEASFGDEIGGEPEHGDDTELGSTSTLKRVSDAAGLPARKKGKMSVRKA